MTTHRTLLAWTLDSHVEATEAVYREIDLGAARRCGCLPCRNFDAVRPERFSRAFRDLLDGLRIDPLKELEVRLVSSLEGSRGLYSGTYGFRGSLLSGRPLRGFPLAKEEVDVFARVGDDAHVALKTWETPPSPWGGGACIRLEFLVVLPWVLEGEGTPTPSVGGASPFTR